MSEQISPVREASGGIEALRENELVSEALGLLWVEAPHCRDELRALCETYGLTITVG